MTVIIVVYNCYVNITVDHVRDFSRSNLRSVKCQCLTQLMVFSPATAKDKVDCLQGGRLAVGCNRR